MNAGPGGRELTDKLRRLRREPDVAREPEAPERTRLPAWFAARARARRGGEREPAVARSDASCTLGRPAELELVSNERGRFALRERTLAPDARHGDWSLNEIAHAAIEDIARTARDPALASVELEEAVYLDVETTGLSGGAGTISFLVALGSFQGGAFTLWQGFLMGPEDEAALLLDVARRVRSSSAVVSFFGKSFDRHRLEDKMRLHGIDPPFDATPHLDLYHPLARLYRSAFADTRLQTMERELCGVQRRDDLPGSFAPEAWFDFLAGRAHRLEDVFRHNADDVLSLVVLAAHLGRTRAGARADGGELAGPVGFRARALAQLCHAERLGEETLVWVERALACDPDTSVRRELAFLRAQVKKRLGDARGAAADFRELAAAGRDRVALEAWIELAKLAEHRLADLALALEASERAGALSLVCLSGSARARVSREVERRLRRVRAKHEARRENA